MTTQLPHNIRQTILQAIQAQDATLLREAFQYESPKFFFSWLRQCVDQDALECAQAVVEIIQHKGAISIGERDEEVVFGRKFSLITAAKSVPMIELLEEAFVERLPDPKFWFSTMCANASSPTPIMHHIGAIDDQKVLCDGLIQALHINPHHAHVIFQHIATDQLNEDQMKDILLGAYVAFIEGVPQVDHIVDALYTVERAEELIDHLSHQPHIYDDEVCRHIRQKVEADRTNQVLTEQTKNLGRMGRSKIL